MNAMFELEVKSLQKLVKDFACLTSVGKLFHRTTLLLVRGKGTASLLSESLRL